MISPHPMCRLGMAAGLCFLLASCRRAPPVEGVPPPNVVLYGVRVRYYNEGMLASVGEASQVTYLRSSGEVTAQDARLTLMRPKRARGAARSGNIALDAPKVEGDLLRRTVEGSGGVEARSGDLWARTDRARYDGQLDQAKSRTPVSVRGRGFQVDAQGFDLDFPTETYQFSGDVHTRVGGRR